MIYEVILLYIVFWIILCENKSIETIIIGSILCLAVALLNKNFLSLKNNKQGYFFKKLRYWTEYVWVLIKEVFIANFNVAKIVLSPNINISPDVVTFQTKLESEFCRTMLANSITLTPGTITVSMENNMLTVHCLDKEYIDGLLDSKFEKILLKVEG
ncbi:Na+/H+ antiporter subunit E [Clostridium ganghwense]|uniref:Na+/H+ antiporter subunit E n=1 Tax=Clostridium ganghwense TaxID=312089 RepID=A0ABT4CV03_9CLOT|nr:Na+/H+ antiporter subunit E [Clostridium ganghwense]MCY6372056.1 Na+/H+ antiporter subunit E [Clostridium ganghwense]